MPPRSNGIAPGEPEFEQQVTEARIRLRLWFREYVLMGLAPIEKRKPRPSDS